MTHQSNNLISVIIPVFNAEKFLQTSIESVINQTYRNIEIILINDGSSDESAKICDNYSDQDSRIKVFHKSNAGPAAARNLGIEIASGGLIFFIDADDCITSDALEKLENIYEKNLANIVIGNFEKIRFNNSEINYDNELIKDVLLDKQAIINYVRSYLKKPNKHSWIVTYLNKWKKIESLLFILFILFTMTSIPHFKLLFGIAYIPSLIMALFSTYLSKEALECLPA